MRCTVTNKTRGTVLGTQLRVAGSVLSRCRGFLFRDPPPPREGMILHPCRIIHTVGLRFAIDVVFVNEEGVVVGLDQNLVPNRRSRFRRLAHYAVELPAGSVEATGTRVGDDLFWHAVQEEDSAPATARR